MPGTRSRLSIRHRVLLLSIIPMLVLATILGSYFIYSRLSDNTDKLIERGKIMVDLLASAAEFGVISGNQYQLRVLSQKTRYSHAEVLDVLFYDDTFNLLHRSGQFAVELSAESPALQSTSGQWIFLSPIFSSALLADNNPELSIHAPEPEQIGWVAVVLSAHNNIATRQEMLRNSLLLISLGLMLTAILASRFGRRITQPIRGLSQVVERLEAGHLDTRAATTHTAGELGLLARGINRMAARIQASSQEQEQQINRATRQLTSTLRHLERQNEELTVARRQADEANRSKDEFLARMSHELRTPLTSVLGFSRLLEQTEQSAEQRHYCSIINQTSSLLLTIIDDILDFSRLQSDAIQLEQIPFDPTLYFNNLLQMQAPMALEKGLQLRSELDPELPPALLGDPTRIGQILTNLLSNAIKFTDHGEVCFRVRSQRQDSICHIELSVQDTGIGISEQQQQHLFKAFIQADNTISRRFGGSGLGLVIAHRLTLLMGGDIRLSSEKGKGTCVNVSLILPLADADTVVSPLYPAEPIPHAASSYQLPCKLRVLLAEDNEFNRILLNKALGQAGAEVIEARTGVEALQIFHKQQIDMVLMDVHMPQMDGIRASHEIRRHSDSLPIIALTANVMTHEHEALLEAGVNEILLKPVDLSTLFRLMSLHCPVDEDAVATLSDYAPMPALLDQVDTGELHTELQHQAQSVCAAVRSGQFDQIRTHSHQLLGLAGLYQLPELETVVAELHQAAVAHDLEACWRNSHRLTRLIEHHQYV